MLDVDILFVQLSFVQLIHLSMKNAALQRFLRNNIKDNSKSESSTNVTYIQKSSVYNPSFLNKIRINNKPIKIKNNTNLESPSRHNISEMTQILDESCSINYAYCLNSSIKIASNKLFSVASKSQC
jgi:hypothetical protein